ncbi:hypothetical protein SH601_07995 [Gracilibacillus sp. S3-1-1]|uniref:Uncharacterized protein n=1 Tax=Gracilibacillus pellucidus TaxID=3095368 RepID=A0ACC6M4X1_9BACI|nr:hypothetical protein [Gracilibacillus sp. S3-1-1]MDX8045933.1 hypothetical protein [Gracilibacillus sp. S3-1-1]
MKYFFYLLLLSLVFSLGMYIGVDRTEHQQVMTPTQTAEQVDEIDIVNQEAVIEEVEQDGIVVNEVESSFLHIAASKGEEVVKVLFDQIVDVTYAIVDGVF